nr:uncharacterized protein LOC115255732 [Aedes albopictus]
MTSYLKQKKLFAPYIKPYWHHTDERDIPDEEAFSETIEESGFPLDVNYSLTLGNSSSSLRNVTDDHSDKSTQTDAVDLSMITVAGSIQLPQESNINPEQLTNKDQDIFSRMIEQSEILYADGLYDFPQPVQMDITICSDLDNESREDSGYETHQVTAASNSEMDSGCDESHLSVRQVLTEHVNAEASIFYEPPTPKKKGKTIQAS